MTEPTAAPAAAKKPPIQLTEAAVRQVRSLLARQKNPGMFLRVGVRGGGCTGLSYLLNLEAEKSDGQKGQRRQGKSSRDDSGPAPMEHGQNKQKCRKELDGSSRAKPIERLRSPLKSGLPAQQIPMRSRSGQPSRACQCCSAGAEACK